MLRTACCRGPLTLALQSSRLQKCVRPTVARQPLCTSQRCLVDHPKSTISAPGSQSRERGGQEKEEKGALFFKLEAGGDHASANGENSAQAGQSKHWLGGVWTSLRSRMQSPVDNGALSQETPVPENFDENTNDTEPEEHTEHAATESTPRKKGGKSKSKRNKSKEQNKPKEQLEVTTIRPARLKLQPVDDQTSQKAPRLSHNLDRVLFNPGVYHMQDHRSGVFNFDPYLASIMPVEEFDFDALKEYITSSKDTKLRELCAEKGLKYCGSTSSMTSILSHFHFLLSAWRPPNFDNLSRSLKPDSQTFSALGRGPAAAFAHLKDGVYAIDADKEYDTENVLSMLGKSMEKLLTLPKEEFDKYRRSRSHQLSDSEKNADETYHFTTLGDFMMRSQLDAHDPRLPGSGVFDLKTRAVVTIRMDVTGYKKGVGYEIRQRFGQWESFEREYCDMIRAAFLKYSLQVRMGRMDGIFVAFHNTQRIFGFQYISLAEMDQAIHGTSDTRLGDQEFKCSVALLNDLLDRATKRFPGRTLRLHVETRPTKVPLTYFFVEPVTEEEMRKTQEAGKPSVEQLEREIQDLSLEEQKAETAQEAAAQEAEAAQMEKLDAAEEVEKGVDDPSVNDAQNEDTWREMMSKVDEAVENESLGVGSIRDAVQEALQHSGLLQDKTELESEEYVDDLVSALTAHSTEAKELGESHASKDDDAGDHRESTTLATLILKVTQGVNENNPNLRAFERKVADLASQSNKPDHPADSDQADAAKTGPNGSVGELEALESAANESQKDDDAAEEPQGELLGMYVSIRNKINDNFVTRPAGLGKHFDWAVEYTVTELPDKRARSIYTKIKKRRKEALERDPHTRSKEWYHMFKGQLPIVTEQGQRFREMMEKQEAGSPVYVAWDTEPLPPNGGPRPE